MIFSVFKSKFLWIFFAVLVALSVAITLVVDVVDPSVVIIQTQSGERVRFVARVAHTPLEHQRGLQHVRALDNDQGMWFVYDKANPLSFWMKDTFIPLDILFVDDALSVLKIYSNVPPCYLVDPSQANCPFYSSEVPARYVLEIPGGQSQARGLAVGDFISRYPN